MIVNPPRSESELSPRLKEISLQALDKFEDPSDRPPRFTRETRQWLLLLGLIFSGALLFRGSLWLYTSGPLLFSGHSALADQYRQYANNCEAQARHYRSIVASGKPGFYPGTTFPITAPQAQATILSLDQQAAMYRRMAITEERRSQGYPVP